MNFEASVHQALRHYLLALQFFTRIPITGRLAEWVGFSPSMLRAASTHFPGVGWVVAACACSVYALLYLSLGPAPATSWVAAALSTAATAVLTGGFHEDGLTDVADGLGGSQERERALDIMKDSRIGAFGAMALALTLLTKLGLLALLGQRGLSPALAALVGAHVFSRFLPLLLVKMLPHVGLEGQSKTLQATGGMQQLPIWTAALWCTPLAGLSLLDQGPGLLAIIATATVAAALAMLLMGWWFRRRLGGVTGDCLGATQQVCELVFYGAALSATLSAMGQP